MSLQVKVPEAVDRIELRQGWYLVSIALLYALIPV